jgi:hypothetical protein
VCVCVCECVCRPFDFQNQRTFFGFSGFSVSGILPRSRICRRGVDQLCNFVIRSVRDDESKRSIRIEHASVPGSDCLLSMLSKFRP